MVSFLYHIIRERIYFFTIKNAFCNQCRILVFFVFVFSACVGGSSDYSIFARDRTHAWPIINHNHPVFDELNRKWVSSFYFDRGMNYTNSRFEVVSFSQLLDRYDSIDSFDAILLNCVDDYQGIVSADDVRRYDLQLATNIKLARDSDRPEWLQPLLILVPDNKNPPFLERFLTANISELRLVRLADYYEPLDKKILKGASAEFGRAVYKDNCLFCHSINGVGGNKGGSLLRKFDFRLNIEKSRFKDTFLVMHSQDNANKQNIKQFVTDDDLEVLSKFLSEIIKEK